MVKRMVSPVDKRLAVLCLVIIGLNLFDVFATLRHLEHGAEELNPLINVLLRRSEMMFLAYKYIIASSGIFLILLHPTPRRAEKAFWLLMPVYALLAVYQISLFYIVT